MGSESYAGINSARSAAKASKAQTKTTSRYTDNKSSKDYTPF